MRIIAGRWAGTDLVSPGGRVRPTAEEVRDAWLEELKAELKGAKVLELFAGTGALGLEALSRGAAHVDFVENGPGALHALKANIAKLRAQEQTRLFKMDALQLVDRLKAGAYDICLADPPYASRVADRIVHRWMEVPFARVLAVEALSTHALPGKGDRSVWGDTAVTIYRSRHGSS